MCVSVPAAATYKLIAKVRGPRTSSNSFWVTIDNHGGPATRLSFEAFPLYQDVAVVSQALGAGEHTVRFWVREDGTYLRSIELALIP